MSVCNNILLQLILYEYPFIKIIGEVMVKRFGYLDIQSNFSLQYESGESDKTLYPGYS